MERLIDANVFSAFIKDAVIKHKYDRLNIDNTLTVADVLQSVCAELDGTGLEGFKNAPTVDAVPVRHGRWMQAPHKRARFCSCCYSDEPYKFADDDANVFDFCPHCGARMDGKDGDGNG